MWAQVDISTCSQEETEARAWQQAVETASWLFLHDIRFNFIGCMLVPVLVL